MSADNPFRIGDKVRIKPNADVMQPFHRRMKSEGTIGTIVREQGTHTYSLDVEVEWPNGDTPHRRDIMPEYLELVKETEMATLGTTRIKIQFDHSGLAEEIIAFRDRLQVAGFTAKQATRITTNAFATPTTTEETA